MFSMNNIERELIFVKNINYYEKCYQSNRKMSKGLITHRRNTAFFLNIKKF